MVPWDITDWSYVNVLLRWSRSVGGKSLPVSLIKKSSDLKVKLSETK